LILNLPEPNQNATFSPGSRKKIQIMTSSTALISFLFGEFFIILIFFITIKDPSFTAFSDDEKILKKKRLIKFLTYFSMAMFLILGAMVFMTNS
jgi:uncharacterized membrane protein